MNQDQSPTTPPWATIDSRERGGLETVGRSERFCGARRSSPTRLAAPKRWNWRRVHSHFGHAGSLGDAGSDRLYRRFAARDRAVAHALSALAVPKSALAESPNLQLVTRKIGDSPTKQTPADGSGLRMRDRYGMEPPSRLPRCPLPEVELLVKRVETMGLEPTTPCVQSRAGSALHAGNSPGLAF